MRFAVFLLLAAIVSAQDVFPPASGGAVASVPTLASTGFSSFTTHPQTSATIADTPAGIALSSPDYGSDNINAACQAAPATPYTLTGQFTLLQSWYVNGDSWGGFAWRDAVSQKIVGYGLLPYNLGESVAPSAYSIDFSDPLTYAGSNEGHFVHGTPSAYLRIADDGTSVYESVGYDGQNFLPVSTVLKSSGYLGASGYNQVCLFLSAHGSAAALTLQSYSKQ